MTLSTIKSRYALGATGTPTKTNIGSTVTIGNPAVTATEWSTADIAYSFKVAAAAAANVATLTLSSGAVAQTTGSPVITDAGEDFEGAALGTAARVYAVLIECTTAGTSTVAGTAGIAGKLASVGDAILVTLADGDTTMGTVTFTFTAGTGVIEATVISKTS